MSRTAIVISALVTALVGSATFAMTARWSRTGSVLKQDGLAYFLYTRSLVFDLDTDLTGDLDTLDQRFNASATEAVERFRRRSPVTGRDTLPWPVGVAFFQAPFYLVGWGLESAVAAVSGRTADSLGPIVQFAFAAGTLFWSLVGFWSTVLCCREIAPPRPAFLATLAAALTGPLVFYTFFHPTMSHGVSFALVALHTLLWLRLWRADEPGPTRTWLVLGLVVGAMVAVRYQNAVFGLLPAALVVREAIRRGVFRGLRTAGLVAAGALPPVLILAAHFIANHGLFRQRVGSVEGAAAALGQVNLSLTSPHFLEALFSCKHGAFYWAPFLAVAFVGLLWAGVRKRGWAWVLVAVILGHAYLIGMLQEINWSAAAAFGMRYLTESAPLFALGLVTLMTASAPRVRLAWWWGAAGLFAGANGLLIGAYSLRTISQESCVTWPEMADGIGRAILLLLGKAG